MQAFEFHAKPKDGIIQIPEQFRSQVAEQVLVIVLELDFEFDGCAALYDYKPYYPKDFGSGNQMQAMSAA